MSLSVGERLKSAREAKKITLEEACRVTKIHRTTLEAIERGEVQEILSPTYARIFLKKYASYLGLDGQAVMQEYLSHQAVSADPQSRAEAEGVRAATAPDFSRRVVPAVTVLIGLVGVAFLAYLAADLFHTLRRPPVPAAQAVSSRETPVSRPALVVPSTKPLKLGVRTSDKVWLQLKSDGEVIFQGVLAKGSQESWTAKKELEIWTGNASAMEITLNGRPLEGLGRGVKKGVKITHAGLQ